MNTFLMIVVMAFPSICLALAAVEYDSPFTALIYEDVKPNECINTAPIGMHIAKRIDAHTYQTFSLISGDVVSRGILKTVKSEFNSEGRINIFVRYVGAKDVLLENGFAAKFGMWEECK